MQSELCVVLIYKQCRVIIRIININNKYEDINDINNVDDNNVIVNHEKNNRNAPNYVFKLFTASEMARK